jgi:hydrogenase-1 operon protein HyaF
MRPIPIPIRALAVEPEEAIDFMPMPREMSTFEMPRLPEPGADSDVAGARDLLQAFVHHMRRWLDAGGEAPALELAGVPAPTLRVLNETLGEGEVSVRVDAAHEIRIQESVFCGVWREQHFAAGGALLHDLLRAAPMPPVVGTIARERAAPCLRGLALPAGAMNVPALVTELADAIARSAAGAAPVHVINLSLLPLSPADREHIDRLLDGGAVVILSRGFGNCRIGSTAARNVWRVQYFNNMNTLILDTLEVVDMPEVALAAREDLLESLQRLDDLVQWMGDSIAA